MNCGIFRLPLTPRAVLPYPLNAPSGCGILRTMSSGPPANRKLSPMGEFRDAGFRFLPGALPFSAGVAALPGFGLERVRCSELPLDEGFRAIEDRLRAAGRPPAALCAVEIRSPKPLDLDAFKAFNRDYVAALERLGIHARSVARTNVCPVEGAPTSPSLHAFAYTLPSALPRNFVISGVAEVPDGRGSYPDLVVRRGDRSPDGLREKARFVLAELERRMAALGVGWADATACRAYSAHAVELPRDAVVERSRPPLLDLDVEMDCRGIASEVEL